MDDFGVPIFQEITILHVGRNGGLKNPSEFPTRLDHFQPVCWVDVQWFSQLMISGHSDRLSAFVPKGRSICSWNFEVMGMEGAFWMEGISKRDAYTNHWKWLMHLVFMHIFFLVDVWWLNYVYIYIRIIYIYIHTYVRMYVSMYVYVCMHVCMHVCMCMYVYVCVCVCMYVYVCVCMCMYMYVYVCICMYMYVYMYVRTYVCMYVFMFYVCMVRTYVHVRTYVCMYLCFMHVCMYVCVHVYANVNVNV